MKVFMIGGTGLLGSEAARELIARGHAVSSIALPPLPTGAVLPPEMKIEYGNYLEMSDDALRAHLTGCEGFVFAAGVDERVEGPAPIYDLYKKYNIDPVKRLLKLCRECGVRHAVILGSYFSYAAKKWPEKKLTEYHPYIRSRIDQEEAAMAFAGNDLDVSVLELPYIFGTQPGRRPVWVFLVENVMSMKKVTMYPKGGSTMVTVRQVGQAVAGALERSRGGRCCRSFLLDVFFAHFLPQSLLRGSAGANRGRGRLAVALARLRVRLRALAAHRQALLVAQTAVGRHRRRNRGFHSALQRCD